MQPHGPKQSSALATVCVRWQRGIHSRRGHGSAVSRDVTRGEGTAENKRGARPASDATALTSPIGVRATKHRPVLGPPYTHSAKLPIFQIRERALHGAHFLCPKTSCDCSHRTSTCAVLPQ